MATDDLVMTEAYIDYQFWPAKRGEKRVTLTISFDELWNILCEESAVIATEDVEALMGAIALRADVGTSDQDAIAEWHTKCQPECQSEEDE